MLDQLCPVTTRRWREDFIYDNEDILLELDGSNNITARYTHGPGIDEPLILEKSGQSFFYHADGLGSITEITDATGALKQQYTYSSFGKIESQLDPTFIQPYTFTAREFDPETGLYFYRKRTYNPNAGTFLQEDPFAGKRRLPQSLNRYAYVRDNPINLIDPLGLLAEVIIWQPVGWGESSFGHVSTNINGTTYSFGPGGMTVMPTSAYMERNSFRDGVGSVLNLTSAEERALDTCLKNQARIFNLFANNCGDPLKSCLESLGFNLGRNLFPVSLGHSLIDAGLVRQFNFYYATSPSSGSSAPWAR